MGREARIRNSNARVREEAKYELSRSILSLAQDTLNLTGQLLSGIERTTQPPEWQAQLARFDELAAENRRQLATAAQHLEAWRQSEGLPTQAPAAPDRVNDAQS